MIYLSVKDKIENKNIIRIIQELDIKGKIYNESRKADDSLENLKKSKIVICDLDIERIKDYLALKKTIIVYKRNNDKLSDEERNILYDKRIYTYNMKNELREILSFLKRKNKIRKHLSIGTIIIILMLLVIAITGIIFTRYEKEQAKKEAKLLQEQEKKKKPDFGKENIVFFGDSITDFYDLEKFYPDLPVVNSGISGNQTKDLLAELENRVSIYNPTKIFILIGTNDIAFTELSNKEIVDNIKKIVKLINKDRPKAKIYIESIYPISKEENEVVQSGMVGRRENKRIKEINKMLKEMCDKEKLPYINLYKLLVNEDDNLVTKYTEDGLHMSDEGYEVITKELLKYINNEK